MNVKEIAYFAAQRVPLCDAMLTTGRLAKGNNAYEVFVLVP